MRRAKILATLGPSSNTQEKIEQLIHAGVNAVRINMSHGTQDEHAATIKAARDAAEKLNIPLAILADLSGPKIRTRSLEDKKPVQLETDALFTLTTRDIVGNAQEVSTTFTELPEVVQGRRTDLARRRFARIKGRRNKRAKMSSAASFPADFCMKAKE